MAREERLAGAGHLLGARRAAHLLPGSKEFRDDVDLLDRSVPRLAATAPVGTGDPEHEQKGRGG